MLDLKTLTKEQLAATMIILFCLNSLRGKTSVRVALSPENIILRHFTAAVLTGHRLLPRS